jgi:DNA-binding NarL/FixJ family response regulator
MNSLKILLVDDHPMIRMGIKTLLEGEKGISSIEEAADGDECLNMLTLKKYDVIIMDIKMPKKTGIETTKEIIKKYPDAKVLALSMHDEQDYIVKMLQAGAKGYLLKNSTKEELVKAVENVSNGENYFSNEVSSIMLSKYIYKEFPADKKEYKSDIKLTKRETEIIRMISEELTNAEIADKLGISVRTVDTHRRNLLQKLDVKNTAGLVRFALQNGILE